MGEVAGGGHGERAGGGADELRRGGAVVVECGGDAVRAVWAQVPAGGSPGMRANHQVRLSGPLVQPKNARLP